MTMNKLFIPQTSKTPSISFDADSGQLVIEGRSIPEDAVGFYRPVMQWLNHYLQEPSDYTELVVKLEYFNTSSSKCLIDIFRKVEKLHARGKEATGAWYYEETDEDMKESGEDFQDLVSMPVALMIIVSEQE